jgi:hypothetical protein
VISTGKINEKWRIKRPLRRFDCSNMLVPIQLTVYNP